MNRVVFSRYMDKNPTSHKTHSSGGNDITDLFLKTVSGTIKKFNLLKKQDKVLVAVSGGADSTALVVALNMLKEQYRIELGIIHLNHLLREEESFRDEQFVSSLSKTLNLPLFSRQTDVGTYAKTHKRSIEQAGREVRYRYFQDAAVTNGYTKIATGHQKYDNAELVLMNFLRGAGVKGLSGIPPKRDDLYIRPLIRTTRKEILAFLESHDQKYMIDTSNHDIRYLRNKIRHELIPHLESGFNPQLINALDRISHVMKQEEDFLHKKATDACQECLIQVNKSSIHLNLEKVSSLHPAMQKRVLRQAVKMIKHNLYHITQTHISDVLRFILTKEAAGSLDLPGQIRVYKKSNTILFKKEHLPLRTLGKLEKSDRLEKQRRDQDR